jgi:glycosyltransferase involved in cell wall biosynthesis
LKKIKVLHVSPDSIINGTERHILSLVSLSNTDIIEPWVAIPVEGIMSDYLDEMNVKYDYAGRVHGYRFTGFLKNNALMKLISLIKREKFDIVHAHLNSYSCFIAKMVGVKYTVHTRHGIFWTKEKLDKMSSAVRRFQKYKSDKIDCTIALSAQEESTMINDFGYDKNKLRKIYNGVSISSIQKKRNGLSKRELFGTDEFIVGAVGRLEEQKNFSLLLDVAKAVIEKQCGIKFIIVGEGSLEAELLQKKIDLGLCDSVQFLGYKENVFDYIDGFDLMIQTSLWEGMPYVILEAMALGKAMISTTTKGLSGVGEVILNKETGYLIDENYREKLVNAVLDLYNDREKLKRFAEAGKKRVNDHFSEEKMVRDTEQIYIDLIKNGKTS